MGQPAWAARRTRVMRLPEQQRQRRTGSAGARITQAWDWITLSLSAAETGRYLELLEESVPRPLPQRQIHRTTVSAPEESGAVSTDLWTSHWAKRLVERQRAGSALLVTEAISRARKIAILGEPGHQASPLSCGTQCSHRLTPAAAKGHGFQYGRLFLTGRTLTAQWLSFSGHPLRGSGHPQT